MLRAALRHDDEAPPARSASESFSSPRRPAGVTRPMSGGLFFGRKQSGTTDILRLCVIRHGGDFYYI